MEATLHDIQNMQIMSRADRKTRERESEKEKKIDIVTKKETKQKRSNKSIR